MTNCPNIANHTKTPEGYIQWCHWVERMKKTHNQLRCPDCGKWAIWKSKDD